MTPKPIRPVLESDETRLDVGHYMRVVWRRKLFVIIPVIFITSITAVSVRFMSPLFVSKSKVHIEKRTRVTSELERQIVDQDRRTRRKDKIAQVRNQLTGREFLEGVVRELGLHNNPSVLTRAKLLHETRTPDVPTEEIAMRILVRGLRSKLKLKASDGETFVLSLLDNDPENAYLLSKVITRNFVAEVKRERMDKLEELFRFSTQQSRIYRDRLDEAERDLRDFQSQVVRDQHTAGVVTLGNVHQARSLLRLGELDLEQSKRRVQNLRSFLRRTFDPLPDLRSLDQDAEFMSLERRLRASIEDGLVMELERMRSNSGGYETLDPRGLTRTALRRRTIEIVDQRYPSVDPFYRDKIAEYAYEAKDLEMLRSRAAQIRAMIEEYNRRAEEEPEKQQQLKSLEERVAGARVNLETFQRTLQSAELSETIMATQLAGGVTVVDPPEKPSSPIRPNRNRLVSIAFLLALVGGVGSVFAVEYLDKSFKDIDEVERVLGLHVVGTVPRITRGLAFGGIPVSRKRAWLFLSSLIILAVVLVGMALYERLLRKQHIEVPQSRASEILGPSEESPAVPKTTPEPAPANH